jgi:hypothetical protein
MAMTPDPSGRSIETAVVVDDLWEEYVWLAQHQPDWAVVRQGVARKGEEIFDVLRLQSRDGETRDIYFDISTHAKVRVPLTLPCPHCGLPLVTAKSQQCRWCFADFHDPDRVIYRKGRALVDRVRSGPTDWHDSWSPAELNNPFGVFTVKFRLRRAASDVVVLRLPEHPSTHHVRIIRIGIACAHAEGCRGVVFDLRQSARHPGRDERAVSDSVFIRLVWALAGARVRVVLLRDHGVARQLWGLETYDTEGEALSQLLAKLDGAGA